MQRVLRKRVIRDLKTNFFRYLALGLMIAMGIFLVVTIVGSGETLTRGTEDMAEETNLEDGEFEVFVPLSDKDKDEIKALGVELEDHFFYDLQLDNMDKCTLRIFKVRNKIDKIHYIDGKEPADKKEVVLEKRFSEEHDLKVGDSIEMAGVTYKISGIGVVSDYDGPQKEISDTSCNSKMFGLVFLTEEAYADFKASGKAQKSEDYLYAYKLDEGTTDKDLKDYLKDLKIDSSEVDDELFQEYWERTGGIEEDLRDAVKELRDATNDVRDGVKELSDNNDDINEATGDIFDAYLEETSSSLQNSGYDVELTEDNYKKEIDNIIEDSDSAIMKMALKDAEKQLSS